jgi:hypothetical protein
MQDQWLRMEGMVRAQMLQVATASIYFTYKTLSDQDLVGCSHAVTDRPGISEAGSRHHAALRERNNSIADSRQPWYEVIEGDQNNHEIPPSLIALNHWQPLLTHP